MIQSIDANAPLSEKQAAVITAAARISRAASDASAIVRVAGAEVEDVRIAPWHGGIEDARDAYLAHNEAWVAYFDAVGQNALELDDNSLSADIRATFAIAHKRFEEALPMWARNDASNRVDDIWNE